MGKVVIRLTESELKKMVNESVARVLKEHDDSFILQIIAQQLAQKGKIYAVNGENETEVELGNDKSADIIFNVESDPYMMKGMRSSSYDVPDDPNEIMDNPVIQVIKIDVWMNGGEYSYQVNDNGIVAKTLKNIIEMDYSNTDIPSEEDYNYYEE